MDPYFSYHDFPSSHILVHMTASVGHFLDHARSKQPHLTLPLDPLEYVFLLLAITSGLIPLPPSPGFDIDGRSSWYTHPLHCHRLAITTLPLSPKKVSSGSLCPY